MTYNDMIMARKEVVRNNSIQHMYFDFGKAHIFVSCYDEVTFHILQNGRGTLPVSVECGRVKSKVIPPCENFFF